MFKKGKIALFSSCLLFYPLFLEAAGAEARFGAGVGFAPATGFTVTSGITRIRFTSAIFLEPTFSFNSYTVGDGESMTTTAITFSTYFGYAFLQHDKTNVSGKGGISFTTVSPEEGSSTTQFGFGVAGEIEQFMTDYFSAILTIPVLNYSSISDGAKSSTFTFGNKLVSLGLIWYF